MQSQHSATIVYVMKIVSLCLTFVSVSWVFSNSFFALFFFSDFFPHLCFCCCWFLLFFSWYFTTDSLCRWEFFFLLLLLLLFSLTDVNYTLWHIFTLVYFCVYYSFYALQLLLVACLFGVRIFFLFFCFNIFLSFVRLLH